MRVSCMIRQAQEEEQPKVGTVSHFAQEMRTVMSPMSSPRGKLTSGDRTPEASKLKKVLDEAVAAAKAWETKDRKAFLEDLRYWLKLAREHADRLYAASYKGGASGAEAGDAKHVRDLIDGCRYQITKLPSIRARGPSKKTLDKAKAESTEKGIKRVLEMLPNLVPMLSNYRKFGGKNEKELRKWLTEADAHLKDAKNLVAELPEGKEKKRAEEAFRKLAAIPFHPAIHGTGGAGKSGLGFNFGSGDASHFMQVTKVDDLEKRIPSIVAILKEIDSLIHGQLMMFASVSNRLRRAMKLRKAARIVDENDIVEAVLLLIRNDSKLYQALSSGKMKPAEAAKEGRMQYLSFATQNLREDVRKAQPLIEKEVKDWVAEMKADKA